MILLKSIQLNNFLSHEKTEIVFNETEKLLLDGKSGSGKSSITEGIIWCLYGKGRSENRSLVRRGAKMGAVLLRLIDGSTETNISRTVSSTGKNVLTITQNSGKKGQFLPIERTGLKDLQDWIEGTFLHASFELFTNSVAYPQQSETSFVQANASKRKDLLLEIVQAGSFDELYEKARKKLTVNELNYAVDVSNIENLEKTIATAENVAKEYETSKESLSEITRQIDGTLLQEKALESEMSNISTMTSQIKDKKTMQQMFANSLAALDKKLEDDRKTVEEFKKIDIQQALKDVNEIDLLELEQENINKELKENIIAQQHINQHLANKPSVHDYTKEIDEINRRLIPLIKDSSKCPAGDACPFVVPIKGQIDFLTEQITQKSEKSEQEQGLLEVWEKQYVQLVPLKDTSSLYVQLEKIQARIKLLSTSKDVVTRYETFEKTMFEIKEREESSKQEGIELSTAIIDINREIKFLEATFLSFDSNRINRELSSVRVSLQGLQKSKEEAQLSMNLAIKAQEDIKKASTELVALKKGILKGQEEKEALELLKEAFSPRGIKAVVVDYLIPQLEDRINNVLGQMSDFRIRLDTQKAKADDDGVKEGLFITIINDQKEELAYENYSGGEKIKITIAISEALASLQNNIGFRLMDENIVSLDSESTEGFVGVLLKLQEKFSQLLIISHLSEIKDLFEKKITIIKTNGISKII